MLAANADLQLGPRRATPLDGDPHELAHAWLVDRREWGALDDSHIDVLRNDPRFDVVAREPQSGLREVVSPEGEEFRMSGDLARHEARARELDHRADAEVATDREALLDADTQHEVARELELADVGNEGNHDLDARRAVRPLADSARGAEDGPRLHLVDLWVHESQPDSSRAEHRVALLERPQALERVLELSELGGVGQPRRRDLLHELETVGHELVQRRVE